MTISVLIPVYNGARTIEATLDSVFRQTVQPDEVIVLLDGGTDDTPERIERFKDHIVIVRQENHGLAFCRNRLVEMARGKMIAFVDSDDLWHPKYLAVQQTLMREYPEALVSFVGHNNFTGLDCDYVWPDEPDTDCANAEWLGQVDFFKLYVEATGMFPPSTSFIRKSAIERLGPEPFQFGALCDCYFFYRLSLLGGVVLLDSPLAAYRVSEGSMSANRLPLLPNWIKAFEKVAPEFQKSDVKGLREAFQPAYAAKHRYYAKLLLGAGRPLEARSQLLRSMAICHQVGSVGKSLAIWAASWFPSFLQPKWPSSARGNVGAVNSSRLSSPATGIVKS